MDSVALKRLRTAWELVLSYSFVASAGLWNQAAQKPELVFSLLFLWALLFAISYLWGSYDLEVGPAYGIRLRTQGIFISTIGVYWLLHQYVIPRLVWFPYGFWIGLYLYLSLLSPLLELVAGKLARLPTLFVFSDLNEDQTRNYSYWGYKCMNVIPRDQLEDWLRRNSDERSRPNGCDAVLVDMRTTHDEKAILELSRLYFVDFVAVESDRLGSYLLGRHCKLVTFMPLNALNRRIKRVVDLLLSVLVLIALSPLLLLVVILIKLDSPGPILYKQRRLGKNMKYFRLLKFRSMFADAEQRLQKILSENPALKEEYARTYKLKKDPRVTKIGRFLRKTSLDEIPQLFNIIRDQMSWVGPRPIVDGEIHFYKDCHLLPFRVPPGATGLWQISGRNETSYEQRVQLDYQYVTHWSYLQDLRILFGTVPAVLKQRGAY